jgi:hypothetical protein
MTYTIPVVGQNTIIIPTGSTNTSTCLTLVGKNVPGYGQAINRNLMNMLQNFAGSALPQAAVEGQLWFDTTARQLKVYNGTTLKTLPMLSFASSTPSYPYTGELWWDSSLNLFKIYNGTIWVVIGPYSVSGSSGAVADSIADSDRILRSILTFNIDGNVIGVLAKEKFVPLVSYNGLVAIDKGFNLTPAAGFTADFANITTLRGITITATNISATAIGNANTTVTANTITTSSRINAGGNIFVSGNIIPTSNVAYDLGNATASWRSLYLSGNTIYFGNLVLKDSGGSFSVFDTTGATPAPVIIPSLNNTPIGNAIPSTGAFTTLTATSGYQGNTYGEHNGTIGVTTPNTGIFSDLTTVGSATIGNDIAGTIATFGYWSSGYIIGDDTRITLTGGSEKDAGVTDASQANGIFVSGLTGNVRVITTTKSTSSSTGAFIVEGGAAVKGNLYVGGGINGVIGNNSPAAGTFTSLTATTGYNGSVNGAMNGTIGATTPNTGDFTSITTSSYANVANVITTNGIYWANGLPFISSLYANSNVAAYLPTYNGTVSNLSTISGGQLTGYHTGPIGANTANTGAFTSLSATSTVNLINSSQYGVTKQFINFNKTNTTLASGDLMGGINWSRTLTDSSVLSNNITSNGSNNASNPFLNINYTSITDHVFTTSIPASTSSFAERMRITRGGNIGIGTTSPQSALHVVGNIISYLNTANTGLFGNVTISNLFTGPGGQFNLWGNNAVSGILLGSDLNGSGYNLNNVVIGYTNPGAAYFTNANASGNLNVTGSTNTNNLYAGNIAFSNGFTLLNYINANPTYSNSNVAAYLISYPSSVYGNSNVAAYIASSNLAIATTPINLSTFGEIQSGRMAARYNAAKTTFFDITNDGSVSSADALIAAKLESSYMSVSTAALEYLQPALGSNYGTKKVGIGFHVGTTSEMLSNAVNIPTTSISSNVNAVVLGYMNNGPRILLMDRAISDNQANVNAYTATYHRFYGNVGIGVANAAVALDVVGQIQGYHTGPIGANTANTGVFTTLTANTVVISSYIKTTPVTFSTLPTASIAGSGARAFITDANTTTFGAYVGGGGANNMPLFSNGSAWFVG